MGRRLRKRCGETPAEALWRDSWDGDMTHRLRKRYDATTAEAL